MTNTQTYTTNHELVIEQSSRCYPIKKNEWGFIKENISKIQIEVNYWYSLANILLGGTLGGVFTLLTSDGNLHTLLATICCGFFSMLCFFFGRDKHKIENLKPKDILSHMNLIESAFREE